MYKRMGDCIKLYRLVAELQKSVSQLGGICYKFLQRSAEMGGLS